MPNFTFSSAALEVQSAIYRVLTTDSEIQLLVGSRVYDDVPDNTAYPFVSIGEVTETDKRRSFTLLGRELTLTIHVWSRAKGFAETNQLVDKIVAALENVQLVGMAGWDWELTNYEDFRTIRDPDGITRHGILRFRVRVSRAS
jgi:hypothetical protein